jgi:hypothetical protein
LSQAQKEKIADIFQENDLCHLAMKANADSSHEYCTDILLAVSAQWSVLGFTS